MWTSSVIIKLFPSIPFFSENTQNNTYHKELIMYKTFISFLSISPLKLQISCSYWDKDYWERWGEGGKLFPHSSTFIIMLFTFICIYLLKYTFLFCIHQLLVFSPSLWIWVLLCIFITFYAFIINLKKIYHPIQFLFFPQSSFIFP